jgi:hypothetical protein
MGLRDSCVITLPFRTVDDRWIDVYIDKRAADYYLVHDAGKTVTELLAHGMRMTETKMNLLSGIADRFGVGIKDGSFLIGCKIDGIHEAIMAVGQCAALGMVDVLKHNANFGQVPILKVLEHELDNWARDRAIVESHVVVEGLSLQHAFDFVCRPYDSDKSPIAISVLKPSYTPMSTAKLYGFTALDLARTRFSKWKKIAILVKASEWTDDSVELIEKHAAKVISVRSVDLTELQTELPKTLDSVAA